MAIKGFKQVIEKKGYRLDDKDRKIFEKEIKRGYFGFDVGDIIEFVIYDASDNQLPQEIVQGKKVRYISYTDENIQKYFDKVPENKFNKKSNNAQEYFIDTEKLIKEAGYSNGVFKTQLTLLNRRLGSEPRLFDKVWIHEISPSRTEVRVLPVVEDGTSIPNSDLQARYDTFVNCGTFTADVLIFFDEFVTQMDVAKVVRNMLMKKGNISEGQDYIKLIEQEFKMVNFEVYLTQVKKLFQEIIDNYRMNRYYNPFESNYGQPTGDTFGVEFDIARVFDEVCEMASNAAEFSLPKQDIRLNTAKNLQQTKTIDKIEQILLTVTSNEEFQSTRPPAKAAQIRGCMDSSAENYNKNATIPSQCRYKISVRNTRNIKVCNDKGAKNFGKDGECDYSGRCNDIKANNTGAYAPCSYPAPPKKQVVVKTSSGGGTRTSTQRQLVLDPSSKGQYKTRGDTSEFVSVKLSPNYSTKGAKWEVISSPSWVEITKGSGTFYGSDRQLKYKVNKNTGQARTGTIVVKHKVVNILNYGQASLTITQAGTTVVRNDNVVVDSPKSTKPTSFLRTSPTKLRFDSNGQGEGGKIQKVTVNCLPGERWSVQDLSGPAIAYGVDISPTSGTGPGTIVIGSISPNSSTNDVTAVFTIRLGDLTMRHEIFQYASPGGSNPFGLPRNPAAEGRAGF